MTDGQKPFSRETLAAQAMGHVDPVTRAVIPSVHLSTTFIRDADNQYSSGFIYGRADNQTVRELETVLAMLEQGVSALVFGSGMSAAIAAFMALPAGSKIVAPKVMYWALRNWLMTQTERLGLSVQLIDMCDLNQVRAAAPGAALIWVETPSNPLWEIIDLEQVASIAKQLGAKLAVDSTCATPVLTQPLLLGADLVMHSASKYLNGHSDVIAGALITKSEDEYWARLQALRTSQGMLLGPFEAYLVMRGIRTLHVRMKVHCQNALALAEKLSAHSLISEVLYPGLATHREHDTARRQMTGGFGGMLSIRLKGGEAAAIAAAAHVKLWKRATSLGGVESLMEHRASVEGAHSPCPTDLLRLSCGIESADDLFADLDQALKLAHNF